MSEHYYTENPVSEIRTKEFTQSIKGAALKFVSVSGVFSFEHKVDKASELLIEAFSPSGGCVLDMGCGYGAIGLFIKALFPEQVLYLADINSRAVEFSLKNAALNGLPVNVLQSSLYSQLVSMKFDDIVSNPPIAAGKKLNTQLISDSLEYLKPNGALWLVAFHNKGGSTLKNLMMESFGNVRDVVKSGGIRVYKSVKA